MFGICVNTSHDHRKCSKKEINKRISLNIQDNGCFVCHPETNKPYFLCRVYSDSIPLDYNNPSWLAAVEIFSDRKSPFWLPYELHRFVFKYFEGPIIPIDRFTEETLSHIKKCLFCSNSFLDFTFTKSCSHHILPRHPNTNKSKNINY